jgi:hypothetical protein
LRSSQIFFKTLLSLTTIDDCIASDYIPLGKSAVRSSSNPLKELPGELDGLYSTGRPAISALGIAGDRRRSPQGS